MSSKQSKKVMGQSSPDDEWIEKVQEDILDPEIPIIDPHHHLWVRNGHTYLMPEWQRDLESGHNIVGTVYAECQSMYRSDGPEELRSLGETEFAAGCAAMAASGTFGQTQVGAGILGKVDMTLGERTRDIFEQHIERSGGRFSGIRFTTAWDAHESIKNFAARPELLLDPDVVAAAGVMADLELTLDCWVYHPQLGEVATLAQAHPNLTLVVNHTGVPILGGMNRGRRNEVYQHWRREISKLAPYPNVFIKLGAFPIRSHGDGIDRSLPPTSEEIARAWSPWMQDCINIFGANRAMFESNFPVQKLFSSYHVTWNGFKRICSGASDSEKQQLFYETAKDAYRLSL